MDVSEQHIASIFMIEKLAKQETSMNKVASKGHVPPKQRLTLNELRAYPLDI
jgi:hypothetical protein